MRVLFLGTPDFAVKPLKAIMESGINVIGVVCNKDKPVGRKQVLTPPPVKVFATENNIPVYQYGKIRVEGVEDLKKLNPDLMITCAFGQILSQEILDIPSMGVFNIHASILPKYRGSSPINQVILEGGTQTGITIMKTDAGIDTGDILFQRSMNILEGETCGALFDRLSDLGAQSIKEALPIIMSGKYELIKQDESLATYTKPVKKEDAKISWDKTANQVVNQIRAYNPSPVAFTFLNGEPFKVYRAEACKDVLPIGKAFCRGDNLLVGVKDGAVSLITVQKAGGKAMNIKDFLRGNKVPDGTELV